MTYAIGRVQRNSESGRSSSSVRVLRSIKRPASKRPQMILAGLSALAISAFFGLANPAVAEGDADRGRDKANTCMGCHGAVGIRNAYPTFTVPKLGGQQAEYIIAALTAYKDGTRPHATMQANAENLSAEDMADIGAYFAQMAK